MVHAAADVYQNQSNASANRLCIPALCHGKEWIDLLIVEINLQLTAQVFIRRKIDVQRRSLCVDDIELHTEARLAS